MKDLKNIITIAAFLTLISALSQTTYTWIGANNSNWSTAANWSPSRLNGQITDILVFNCSGNMNIQNVQQQTVGQIKVLNNTHVTLIPATGNSKTISINGSDGTDLAVESGSALDISGNDPKLGIFLKAGATASISGQMSLKGSIQHYVNAQDANSFAFENGSVFSQQCPGNVFTNAGTSNAIIFKSGSIFIIANSSALNPFALTAPESKVKFEDGSTYIQNSGNPSSLSFNGRNYSNFEIASSINITLNESLNNNIIFNNFTIGTQSGLTISSSNSSSLTVNGTLTLNNSKINLENASLKANGNVNRTSGYVNGMLIKPVTQQNNEVTFEVGTANGYSPVTLVFNNVISSGKVSVKAIQNFHPNINDTNLVIKRYWSISGNSIKFDKFSASFNYLSTDFNTYFSEQDENSMLVDYFGATEASVPFNSEVESRDILHNVITIRNAASLGDFTNAKNLSVLDNHASTPNNSPKEFSLSQNYPNPFNPSTKIDYTLPTTSKVSIKIFDITGREVYTVVNETKEAGTYTMNFNASSLSSGVYFYKITANNGSSNFEKTMKMVIVK